MKQVLRLLKISGKQEVESMHRTHLAPLPMTPLEHSLQAAHHAAKVSTNEDFIIAALLHDCGHLLARDAMHQSSTDLSTVEHGRIGSEWLQNCGFSRPVCELVSSNSDAQRYLCHADAHYYHGLSDAAKASVAERGGPMAPEEAASFESLGAFKAAVALRRCCDEATAGAEVAPGLARYRCMLEEHLGEQLAEQGFWQDLGELGTYHVKR